MAYEYYGIGNTLYHFSRVRIEKNYSIEVLNMLNQYEYMLTPRLSQELLWSRFVNTHSIPGRNIPCDLFQEHLNRVCKEAVRGLRANKTEKAITKIGKTFGTVVPVLDNYDTKNRVTHVSGAHKVPSSGKYVNMIIKHLLKPKYFQLTRADVTLVLAHLGMFTCIGQRHFN